MNFVIRPALRCAQLYLIQYVPFVVYYHNLFVSVLILVYFLYQPGQLIDLHESTLPAVKEEHSSGYVNVKGRVHQIPQVKSKTWGQFNKETTSAVFYDYRVCL